MLTLSGVGFWLFCLSGIAKHLELRVNNMSHAFFCAYMFV